MADHIVDPFINGIDEDLDKIETWIYDFPDFLNAGSS
ncbi:uncharacterized protein G2W53_023721 [Senna tora]|uniref:Uncharacterized protein n=1 Tax=Senna tora TaxID=362788 RepID=A0A834TBX9_9FABA|nr:uncharacterized protein G2W53_023721 [Senna tora]